MAPEVWVARAAGVARAARVERPMRQPFQNAWVPETPERMALATHRAPQRGSEDWEDWEAGAAQAQGAGQTGVAEARQPCEGVLVPAHFHLCVIR